MTFPLCLSVGGGKKCVCVVHLPPVEVDRRDDVGIFVAAVLAAIDHVSQDRSGGAVEPEFHYISMTSTELNYSTPFDSGPQRFPQGSRDPPQEPLGRPRVLAGGEGAVDRRHLIAAAGDHEGLRRRRRVPIARTTNRRRKQLQVIFRRASVILRFKAAARSQVQRSRELLLVMVIAMRSFANAVAIAIRHKVGDQSCKLQSTVLFTKWSGEVLRRGRHWTTPIRNEFSHSGFSGKE